MASGHGRCLNCKQNTEVSCKKMMDTGTQEDAALQLIYSSCLCRNRQIDKLTELFGTENEIAFPNIFIHGHMGTGKTHVLKTLMNVFQLQHVFINCIECHSSKLIFDAILEGIELVCDVESENGMKCDNFNDFVRNVKLLSKDMTQETFYIIFEKAERMRNMDSNLLAGFFKLAEVTMMNICVIFVTEITLEKFFSGTCFPLPVQIYFSEYSQQELIEIMSLDCPEGFTKQFYATYCKLVVSVFHLVCRDLNELKHLALLNFPKFCEPLRQDDGVAVDVDVRKLWRNIEPQLKRCLSTVYLREISNAHWEEMKHQHATACVSVNTRLPLELPFLSKYLLIAAFLASHNPPRTDRRFFCKQTYGKMSKRTKTSIKKCSSDGKITGPKAFPLDRLMAILFSILDEEIDPNASLLTQVSSLVSLNLLAKVSADDQIDLSKYKCLVDLHFIKSVAENVDFHLEQYLFEL